MARFLVIEWKDFYGETVSRACFTEVLKPSRAERRKSRPSVGHRG